MYEGVGINYPMITAICAILMLILMAVALFIWKGKVDLQLRVLERIGEMMKSSGMDRTVEENHFYDQQYMQTMQTMQPAQQNMDMQAQPEVKAAAPDIAFDLNNEMESVHVAPMQEIAFGQQAPQVESQVALQVESQMPQFDPQPVFEQPVQSEPVEGFSPEDPMFRFQQQAQQVAVEQEPQNVTVSDIFGQQAPQVEPQQTPAFEQQMPQFNQPQQTQMTPEQEMQQRIHMQTQQAMAEKYNMAKSGKVYDKSEIESIIKD